MEHLLEQTLSVESLCDGNSPCRSVVRALAPAATPLSHKVFLGYQRGAKPAADLGVQ